jgi:hypothetical protein
MQWEKALELFDSMPDRGLQPNIITLNAVLEALGKNHQINKGMAVLGTGRLHGLLEHIWVSKSKVDLHNCSAAMARVIMAALLRDLSSNKQGIYEVTVVTGRGDRSKDGEAVLPNEVRSFLASVAGPTVTEVPGNPGRFILTRESIMEWLRNPSQFLNTCAI